MKLVFLTSSRSDFGLIRPIVKYAASRAKTELACLGGAAGESTAALKAGLPPLEIRRFRANGAARLKNPYETVAAFSSICGEFSQWLRKDAASVDWIVAPGDRFEILAAVIAAHYTNVPIAHIFGGDRSEGGHLDDNVRHVITKLAHLHFPVSSDSERRILRLGEERWRVRNVGSPVVEAVREALSGRATRLRDIITPARYNVMCTYHPIGTEPERAGRQFAAILRAFRLLARELDVAFILTYPNNEYGSQLIIDEIRRVEGLPRFFAFESLGWRGYLSALSQCDLVVGNSSSGMLEAPIVGVPTLDIGTRQKKRLSPPSVFHEESYDAAAIARKMKRLLLATLSKTPRHPYGDGRTSRTIFRALQRTRRERTRLDILQKKGTY